MGQHAKREARMRILVIILISFLLAIGSCQRREDLSEDAAPDSVAREYGSAVDREYDPNVDTWSAVTVPSRGDWEADVAFRRLVNSSRNEWVVRRVNGKVLARLDGDRDPEPSERPRFGTTVVLEQSTAPASLFAKVDDGWIAAYDVGEFGAAVYWYNETGKKRRKLSDHQIHQFIREEARLFAVEGWAMGLEGSMVELRKEGGRWVCEEFLPLPGSGRAAARIGPGDYLIVADNILLRANLEKELNILTVGGYWDYPNSVALSDDGSVYVGMRQLVARCKLGMTVQDSEYLVPNENWLRAHE